jgi:hypothetical protein
MSDMADILKNAPRECWLALDREERRVLGRGENMEEAVREAKEKGEDDPVLIWAPRTWIPGVYFG